MLTLVGDDRAGLVSALAEIVSTHDGNWERSQLAELAGAFAGIVEVSVPADRTDAFTAALAGLQGLLTIATHPGRELPTVQGKELRINVLGNDHPGIVREVSAVLERHQISIDTLTTRTVDAPMSGGRLFEADVVAHIPDGFDTAAIGRELEQLAAEIQVDLTLDEASDIA